METVGSPSPSSPGYYIPGARGRKLLMILFGLTVLLVSLADLWPTLRLMSQGVRTTAVVARIIKSKPGAADQIITDTTALNDATQSGDRSYTFTDEFEFRTLDGRNIVVRPSTSSVAKPLYPLLDDDGLPSETTIYYDPNHPESVAFPMTASTWFAPGVFAALGVICVFIGSFLFYWADKPIELPHIPTEAELEKLHLDQSSSV